MARRCEFTGKGVQAGNNVSHANNRSRRRFLPNMQVVSFLSEALGEHIQVRLSVHAIRSIEKRAVAANAEAPAANAEAPAA
jgi:large subunit ribosomal protein L28